MRLTHVRGVARCIELLEVVDAAFARPGGPAAHYMADEVCPGCPIWKECLEFAMATGERGPWGGTTERERHLVHHLPNTTNIATRYAKVTPRRRRRRRTPHPNV